MDFPGDGILSGAKPAACAASPVGFAARDNTKTRLFRCPFRRFMWIKRTILQCDRYSAHPANRVDAKSVHEHL